MVEDFGPYRIVRKIAVGGMAEIYLARQRAIEGVERTVVIKRIHPSYIDNPEFVTMFLDEARLLAALAHPNIAQVLDLGKIEDSYYLVMEYIRGPTLGALLTAASRKGRGALPERAALGIALNIAEALAYVHARRDDLGRPLNIVHRDLNPANVMVSYDGAVKLIDFGIAKAATKVYETRTGVIKGTYGYIAPEQLTRNAPVDHRADVFALGVLLYEMSVGQHPFDVSDEPNLIDRILNASYKRPRQIVPSFPKRLDRLIASCLSPHPEGRPADVPALIDALTQFLGSCEMVPTMRDVAEITQALVPDREGPLPLRPLTRSQLRRPFTADPSRTMKLPQATDDDPTMLEDAPNLADLLESQEMTIRLATPDPRSDEREQDEDAAETMIAPLSHEEQRRLLRESRRQDDVAGLSGMRTNKLAPIVDEATDGSGGRYRVSSGKQDAVHPPGRRLRTVGMFAASVLLVGGVGLLAFMTARAIGGNEPATRPPGEVAQGPAEEAVPAQEQPVTIQVRSEPSGAAVYVNGEDSRQVTPAPILLPPGGDSVWIRVSMDGYITQEREVQATVGAARFVLTALEVLEDAGITEPAEGEVLRPTGRRGGAFDRRRRGR